MVLSSNSVDLRGKIEPDTLILYALPINCEITRFILVGNSLFRDVEGCVIQH